MSNQHEIKYMLGSLKLMHEKLGGPNTSTYKSIQRRVWEELSSISSRKSFYPKGTKLKNYRTSRKGKVSPPKMLMSLIVSVRVLSNSRISFPSSRNSTRDSRERRRTPLQFWKTKRKSSRTASFCTRTSRRDCTGRLTRMLTISQWHWQTWKQNVLLCWISFKWDRYSQLQHHESIRLRR